MYTNIHVPRYGECVHWRLADQTQTFHQGPRSLGSTSRTRTWEDKFPLRITVLTSEQHNKENWPFLWWTRLDDAMFLLLGRRVTLFYPLGHQNNAAVPRMNAYINYSLMQAVLYSSCIIFNHFHKKNFIINILTTGDFPLSSFLAFCTTSFKVKKKTFRENK
jgi:hypothetical protein